MTLALRPRRPAPVAATDLSGSGVHRDPTNHDPIATGGFAQRLVHRLSSALNRSKPDRRSFLTRTAVVGSALAVGPLDFILKPGTAYGYLCGTCSDGWTAFCCTINGGRNTCPPGSFVAGWWKADNAAYCCGSARYIIDCNATCPTQCSCRCSGASCDGRRTCCNQFRYGQCNTQISCYGPVVCRVATCVVPWVYDPTCTTTSRTDNRTVEHGAPCLSQDCDTPIQRKYRELGGAAGYLGTQTVAERAVRGSRPGRVARYQQRGSIYWSSSTGAHPLWGRLHDAFDAAGGIGGTLGYPKSDILTTPDGRAKYTIFQYGRVYSMQVEREAYLLTNAFSSKHQQVGGVRGSLGYPVEDPRPIRTSRGGTVQTFERGRIYQVGSRVYETHGSIYECHQANGGLGGAFGYPTTDVLSAYAGGRVQNFERGMIWSLTSEGISGQGLVGVTLFRFVVNGGVDPKPGHTLGYPTRGTTSVGDGRGTYAIFQRGRIYGTDALGAYQVHGGVLDLYLSLGGPTGDLGYPTSELDPPTSSGVRSQRFERGRIDRLADGTIVRA